jgi:membrane fusion protein (multidrug efflux system)
MNASTLSNLPISLKTMSDDKAALAGQASSSVGADHRPAKRRGLPFLYLALALSVLAGAGYWFQSISGFVETDDATVESHVIQVSPKLSTHVKAVHFDDNYHVKRGELLIELDPRDFAVSVASAEANFAAAKSKLAEAEAQQNVALASLGQVKADLAAAQATGDNAAADFLRNGSLYQTKVIDRREYDASVAQTRSANANVESAAKKVASQEAQVKLAAAQYVTAASGEKQAEAQLQQAQLQLSYTKIFAPFEGRVTKKSVEPGNYVQPGQTLFSLVPPNVWVVANFKETELKEMKVGQPVSVRVDAAPGREFAAHVESFQVGTGGRFTLFPAENATGNFVKVVQRVPVKILFDEPAENLEQLWAGESVEPRVNVRQNAPRHERRALPLDQAILGALEDQPARDLR